MKRPRRETAGIYLDWAADINPQVAPSKAERKWLETQQGFARDSSESWQVLREHIEKSRRALAKLLHVQRSWNNIIFSTGTVGGFQLLTQAFGMSQADSIIFPGDEIVVSDSEFPTLYEFLQGRYRLRIARLRKCCNADEQRDAVLAAVTKATRLVYLSHVLYQTGTVVAVGHISGALKSGNFGVLLAVDGSQAVGQIDVNLARDHCDFYMGDTHKWLQGPNNVGFLFASKPTHVERLLPLTLNPLAASEEYARERRSCTKSGIVAFAIAAARPTLEDWLSYRNLEHLRNQNSILSGRFLRRVGEQDTLREFLVSPVDGGQRTGVVAFEFGSATRYVYEGLKKQGVSCSLHEPIIPSTLREQVPVQSLIRLSFSDRWNDESDIATVFGVLVEVVAEVLGRKPTDDCGKAAVYGA